MSKLKFVAIVESWTCDCGTNNNDDWSECIDCGKERP